MEGRSRSLWNKTKTPLVDGRTTKMCTDNWNLQDSGELKLELEDPAKYVFHHVRQTPGSRGSTIAINYWDEPVTNADERVNVTD
ncbi:hypothetical protein RHMOL_Rhmol09G0081000 [Rhododendron molle]|uniref:Uncharacterized protein n=1 Tax=Rhododendron molle TaxID=49168 RepID=A0ACC0MCD9_RHOML|nr:hypothetical protein RHMOL_Rhmol09G0081000 [Rhododendron molle]